MPVSIDYVVRETGSNLWRNRLMTVAAVLTVAVSLTLVGAALLLRQGAANASGEWERGTQVTVWMEPNASAHEVSAVGTEISLEPVLVVDGATVLATRAQLSGASVTAKVVGEEKGPKINAMTYKNKSNQRRRWGHRQHYATLEITAITAAG